MIRDEIKCAGCNYFNSDEVVCYSCLNFNNYWPSLQSTITESIEDVKKLELEEIADDILFYLSTQKHLTKEDVVFLDVIRQRIISVGGNNEN